MKKSSTYKKWKITPIQADFGITLLLDKNSDPVQKDCLLVCVKSIKKSYPNFFTDLRKIGVIIAK